VAFHFQAYFMQAMIAVTLLSWKSISEFSSAYERFAPTAHRLDRVGNV
jgi:hypothetical protein